MSTSRPKGQRVYDFETGQLYTLYPEVGSCNDKQCYECESQFRQIRGQMLLNLRYDRSLSIADAKRVIDTLKKSISEDYLHLVEKVRTNGNSIMKRWIKKSVEERKVTVMKAYPEIPSKQWVLAHVAYEYPNWPEQRSLRSELLTPWLNIPALVSEPNRLLALLHTRTMYSPEAWVAFDKDQTKLGWYGGGLAVDFADCCVVLHGPKYGDIVSFNKDKVHRWDICAYPRAKLILEAQSIIMQLLRKTVDDLLKGISGIGSSTRFDDLVHIGFRRCIGDEAWSKFSNQPFSSPSFDMDYLVGIADSRYAEAFDHMELLQTDAKYLQYYIKASCAGDKFHKAVLQNSTNNKFAMTATRIWHEPFNEVQNWKFIMDEVNHAKGIYDTCKNAVQRGRALPKALDEAFACFELFVVNIIQNQTLELCELIPRLKVFQHHFTFNSSQPGKLLISLRSENAAGHNDKQFLEKDPIFWALHMLSAHNFELDDLSNPAMLFQFLHVQLSSASIEERSRIEQRLFNALSSLASSHEILNAIRHFRPACHYVCTPEAQEKSSGRLGWRVLHIEDTRPPPLAILDKEERDFEAFVNLPFPRGARDSHWLQKATDVRQLSRKLWSNAREYRRWEEEGTAGLRLTAEDKRFFADSLSMDSSPGHLAALEAEQMEILRPKPDAKLNTGHSSLPATTWSNSETPSLGQVILTQRPKEKQKTRGAAVDIEPSLMIPDTDTHTDSTEVVTKQAPLLSVKAETVRVLIRLFPSELEEHAAKPLDWKSFVIALEDCGFIASSSGGSAVIFTKVSEGRIVFHRPHPVAKIDQDLLQGWGKRMRKWFGWERKTFVDRKM